PSTFVGEVVMRQDMSAFLQAARDRGCRYQVGTDMLFEQIPAYLEFFGLPSTSAEELRRLARLDGGGATHRVPPAAPGGSVSSLEGAVA
ncbi:MAG: hypothetical protein ACO26I_09930, partial [Burkholderiaceae bacterium]